jgi:hypothetical protein
MRQDLSATWAAARARGEDTRSEPESLGGDDEEEDEVGRRRKQLHLPILCLLRTFPRLVTSSADKRGSLPVWASQNGPKWEPCHRLAHRRSHSSY